MKKITKNNKGFSLIELIIVIAIMAVLVAIIAPNLTKYLGSSKEKTDSKNLDEVKQQVLNAISDASTNDIGVPTGTLTITGSGSTITIAGGDGGSFDDILKKALKGSSTQSKKDPNKKSIEIDITGDVSNGYDVGSSVLRFN